MAALVTNFSTLIFITNPDAVKAVKCIYDHWPEPRSSNPRPKTATFKCLVEDDVRVGDFFVVPSPARNSMSVNEVVEIDGVEVDIESGEQIAWLICKVDETEYRRRLALEKNAAERIKSAEKTRRQNEIREAILKDNPAIKEVALLTTEKPAAADPVAAQTADQN